MRELSQIGLGLLALCISCSSPSSAQTANKESEDAPVVIPQDRLAVDTTKALSLLDAICGASLPDFSTVNQKALDLEFIARSKDFFFNKWRKTTDFTAESPIDDLGVYVTIFGDGHRTCGINYRSNETAASYAARLAPVVDLGSYARTGKWPKYRNKNAIFSASTSSLRKGGRLPLWLVLTVK